jgi:hypothetical protein
MRWPLRRQSKEEELDEEILAHLAIEAKRRVEAGETPEEAERSARREFGNAGMVKEVTRGMWRFNQFEAIAQDLRTRARSCGNWRVWRCRLSGRPAYAGKSV